MQSLSLRHVSGFGSVASVRPARTCLTVVAVYKDRPAFVPGRKWKRLELNDNGNVVRKKMHVRRGDFVQVIAGDDKGKTGEIIKVLPKTGLVVVENVNIKTRHLRPIVTDKDDDAPKDGRVRREYPIHHSNVQHFSKEKKVRSRIGHKVIGEGDQVCKVRYLIKTGEILDHGKPASSDLQASSSVQDTQADPGGDM